MKGVYFVLLVIVALTVASIFGLISPWWVVGSLIFTNLITFIILSYMTASYIGATSGGSLDKESTIVHFELGKLFLRTKKDLK